MEKAMSVEERIRRAEDIYNRRNGVYATVSPKQKKTSKSSKGNVKKLLMQIFVCLSVYIIFYSVTNRDYIFSEQFRNEVNSFFTEKTKISEWYLNAKGFIFNKFNINEDRHSANNSEEKNEEADNNIKEENAKDGESSVESQEQEMNKKENSSNDENIGGAEESIVNEKSEEKKNEELSEQELMEKTAKEIKEKISFIYPIKGRISSTFGWRNPTTASVPKYHTGLDIAATEGTVIKSATDGKVIMASTQGDYGNHYQIQIQDVTIVYAHCKKLYLKEGDIVKQGQEIAEVGTTGNSTGPHLHFEIRKGDMRIDPQLIL